MHPIQRRNAYPLCTKNAGEQFGEYFKYADPLTVWEVSARKQLTASR